MLTTVLALSSPRYDQAQQKTIHNAYAKSQSIYAQLRDGQVRSLELDVHRTHYRNDVEAGNWAVFHVNFPWLDRSNCPRLTDCLGEVARFHAEQPQHEPITLFIDLKDDFAPGHSARSLDGLFRDAFGVALYEPSALVARCDGARDAAGAVERCGWPNVDDLRGRILVVTTGGTLCGRTPLDGYRRGGGEAAFVAPGHATCPTNRLAVFANLTARDLQAHRSNTGNGTTRGLITRVYDGWRGGLSEGAGWRAIEATGAQFLATDRLLAQ